VTARDGILRALALALALVGVLACSSPPSDARVVAAPPDRASFPAVADVLEHRCGSLDCHGTVYRNLRLYGREGLRLSPFDRPTSKPGATTVAEYDEDFLSVVALEPEAMSAVVREGGAAPERLTLVRKARGAEHHKGGVSMSSGDDADRCVTSWLSGRTDLAACDEGLRAPVPPH
jgi:hypothetical protein